eukprot:250390_1
MSSRYTMASILTALFICIINGAQRETVFDSTNSFEWATGTWTLDGASFGTFPNCPSYAKCVRLGPNGGELYKYFSTLGYHSINAEWTMRSELVLTQPSGRRVKLFYSLSIETSDDPDPWITVSNNYASDSEITSYSAPLPDQTDDHDIVGIWFYLNAEDPGAAAYINDFKLTGIKITQPPTANPTIHPTLSTLKPSLSPTAFPTRFPTESPTQFPTKSPTKPPTSHPSKSPIATQYPSKYPTLNPMRPTLIPTLFPTHEVIEYTIKTIYRTPKTGNKMSVVIVQIGSGVGAFSVCMVCVIACYLYRNSIQQRRKDVARLQDMQRRKASIAMEVSMTNNDDAKTVSIDVCGRVMVTNDMNDANRKYTNDMNEGIAQSGNESTMGEPIAGHMDEIMEDGDHILVEVINENVTIGSDGHVGTVADAPTPQQMPSLAEEMPLPMSLSMSEGIPRTQLNDDSNYMKSNIKETEENIKESEEIDVSDSSNDSIYGVYVEEETPGQETDVNPIKTLPSNAAQPYHD